ncbi:MAG: hypothetical protein WBO58_01585 [Gammaproteobacteria bacterium]
MFSRYLVICVLAFAVPFTVQAASDNQKAAIKLLEETCATVTGPKARDFFPEFEQQVHDNKMKYCGFLPQDFNGYAGAFRTSLDYLKSFGATDAELVDARVDLDSYLTRFEMPVLESVGNGNIEMNLRGYKVISNVNSCNAKASELKSEATCKEAIEEFVAIYNDAQGFHSLYTSKVTGSQLDEIEANWASFLDYSKSQTVLELFLNGQIYKNSESAQFRNPPSYQLVFLHPGVVIENVSEASDGQETEEALILDIVGFNNWTQDEWYFPSGLSYGLVYKDRKDIEDWGHALSFYFKSKYVLGITDHDGERGYFVSIDLLELFKDKKKTFDTYKKNFESSNFSNLAGSN